MRYEIKPFEALTGLEVYKMVMIREAIFVVEQNCPYQDCDGQDLECDIMLVWDGQRLVATLRLVPAEVRYDKLSIGRVVVDRDYRGQGIAKEMMLQALAYIKTKHGPIDVVLSGQVAVKSLYEKCGFKVISDVYLEDGIDHVKMLLEGNRV